MRSKGLLPEIDVDRERGRHRKKSHRHGILNEIPPGAEFRRLGAKDAANENQRARKSTTVSRKCRKNDPNGPPGSPPPLPELLFETTNRTESLVGSTFSFCEDDSWMFGSGSDEGGTKRVTNHLPSMDFNSNLELNTDSTFPDSSYWKQISVKASSHRCPSAPAVGHNRLSCSSSSSRSRSSRRTHRQSSSKVSETLPSSRRNLSNFDGHRNLEDFVSTLRKERSKLLQEIEEEEKIRSSFYSYLDSLNQRLRNLPQQYNASCERWRLEGEISRVQEALSERVVLRRRDQRLHAINAIEKTIQRLRQNKLTSPIRDSIDVTKSLDETKSQTEHYHALTMDLVNANQVVNGSSADMLQSEDESSSKAIQGEDGLHHSSIEAVVKSSWPFDKALWHSSPPSVGVACHNAPQETTPGIMSVSNVTNRRAQSQQQLLTHKVEMVYGLLSMFSSGDRDNMSRTLLAMSSSPDSCVSMRQSGCLPLLIQLLHGNNDAPPMREARLRAAQALHNIVHSHHDDKRGRREARVLKLLEQLRDYADLLWEKLERLCAGRGPLLDDNMAAHPGLAMAALMKLSFDEEHRHAMCSLGGLHAITELITMDHEAHSSSTADQHCITLRRYAGMALTNLTFGDGTNKAMLCSFKSFMCALVSQLHSPSEDLRQVTASVLRNLSWRADSASKTSLREVRAITALTQAAIMANKESTLKVILSAIWNLSAHCSINKADICNVKGALEFICSTLTYKSQSKTLAITENGGGILRNISSHIAVRDDLRQILRDHNTLPILLSHLRSPSLTVVSNACGTLWNLSARCPEDQALLWKEGAIPMLRSLINSKHKMISMGSSAALKNLLQAKPEGMSYLDGRQDLGLPILQARRQKALEQELDQNLAETCDNIDSSPRTSPTATEPEHFFRSTSSHYDLRPCESQETVASSRSEGSRDRTMMGHHVNGDVAGLKSGNSTFVDRKHQLLANKYHIQSNGTSRSCDSGPSEDKPNLQVNNFMRTKGKKSKNSEIDNKTFSDEDQPTNYSLWYTEDPEDVGNVGSQSVNNRTGEEKFLRSSSIHDDAVKTFCTEGTPYNFSTSTSLTDLRDSSIQDDKKNKKTSDASCCMEDSDIEISQSETATARRRSRGRSKGSSSGDKPTTYCVEGTPISLSRVSSMSSISSAEIDEQIDKELMDEEEEDDEIGTLNHQELPESAITRLNQQPRQLEEQTPVVNDTGGPIQACNDTPLMFSRTTSVSSLSSFEIHSLHDDRSSIVSDFSRIASGVISPSDLPDSPSQTFPSSPKRERKCPEVTSKIESAPSEVHLSGSFFRDTSRPFMDEGTPLVFSHGTSLSSLTFDDEDIPLRSCGDGKDSSSVTSVSSASQNQQEASTKNQLRPSRDPNRSSIPRPQSRTQGGSSGRDSRESRTSSEGPPPRQEARLTVRTPSEGPPLRTSKLTVRGSSPPDGEMALEADEKRLAALIKSGMPSSKIMVKSPSGGAKSLVIPPPPPPPPIASIVGQSSSIPIKTVNLQVTVEPINLSLIPDPKSNESGNWSGSDSVRKYYTEGTPKMGSQTGSTSDLSQLSIPGERGSRQHTSDSEDSVEGKKLLEKCIRSGKPTSSPRSKESSFDNRPLSSPRQPSHRPIPVARVIGNPAVKMGVVNPQIYHCKSPSGYANESRTWLEEREKQKNAYKGKGKIPTSVVISPTGNEDITPKYINGIENASSDLSRHSSANSIGTEGKMEELKHYSLENTPVNFSHSSSLSSLSVDESDDTTIREEALLRQCINQGMPKGTNSRISSTSSGGKTARRVVPGVPMERLQLNYSENSGSRRDNQEAESTKLLTEKREKEKQSPNVKMPMKNSCPSEINNQFSALRESSESSPEDSRTSDLVKETDNCTESWQTGVCASDASFSESNLLKEALQLASVVSSETNQQAAKFSNDLSTMSLSVASSTCLDEITPPSAMSSVLSLSVNSSEGGKTCYKNPVNKPIECRHTAKLPQMIHRAIGDQGLPSAGDGGSLASSCHSNLDNICPPSLVEDDMESSMISVASISSEAVEPRDMFPSAYFSCTSDVLNEIAGPARQIAKHLQKEAGLGISVSVTIRDDGSTFQEITEMDDTLAPHPDGNISDTELAVDDLPNDIPDLPQDSPIRIATPSAKGSPKMSSSQDRFKTFTREGARNLESPSSPASQRSLKQRRAEDADRFKTRTIAYHVPDNTQQQLLTSDEGCGRIVPAHSENNNLSEARRSFRRRRQQDPSRYQTRTIEAPVNSILPNITGRDRGSDLVEFQDSECLGLTQAQMDVLSQDANIVICSLNENREGMTVNDSDLFAEENILDIETLSLISNEDDNEISELLMDEVLRKPRVVKPKDVEEEEKGIRGGKRMQHGGKGYHQSHASPSNIQLKSTCVSNKQNTSPKQPRATRASALRQSNLNRGVATAESSSRPSSSAGSSAGSSPRLGGATKCAANSSPVLRRQNTFTKDNEQTTPDKPARKKSPPSKGPSKSRVGQDVFHHPPPPVTLGTTHFSLPKSNSQDLSKAKDSHSSDYKIDGGSNIKKDVTSRIASLWRKVEKAQSTKPQSTKNEKVWIGGKTKTPEETSHKNRLVRSSTFEKASSSGGSYLGLKLSRFKKRDTKSSPPSGASTPIDSRPKCLVSPIRMTQNSSYCQAAEVVVTPRAAKNTNDEETREKRLSRLGSFIVVDDDELCRGQKDVHPSLKNDSGTSSRSSSATRIPLPHRPVQNDRTDSNGNSTIIK